MRKLVAAMGVTLLEVMLVLAIAAMIIVMSIRYYQSATISQQVNVAMQEILAITAAMDNLAIGSQSYANITTAKLSSVVGSANLISPTNGTITVTTSSKPTQYKVEMELNAAICISVASKLAASKSYILGSSGGCSSDGTLSYTYDSSVTQ